MLACQTGPRASELTSLTISDVHLGTEAHGSCTGKGHSESPLTVATVAVLDNWLAERASRPATRCSSPVAAPR
jgi:integrase